MNDFFYRWRMTRANGSHYVSDDYVSQIRANFAKRRLEEDGDIEFTLQFRHKDSDEWRDLV